MTRDYAFRNVDHVNRGMQDRRAQVDAAFVLPYLQPGMSLVDIGCGQGTITAGLAEVVAPGEVVGFDPQEDHLEHGRAFAEQQRLSNVQFRSGDVYDPPCEPASFDVAYANAVLSHLNRPDDALQSIWGVLKPGGLVALRDRGGGYLVSGSCEKAVLETVYAEFELMVAAIDASSRNPYGSQTMGEVLNQLCRRAGFEEIHVSASWSIATSAEWAARGNGTVLPAPMAERVVSMGQVSRDELNRMDSQCAQWLDDPDGYMAAGWFEVVARKP